MINRQEQDEKDERLDRYDYSTIIQANRITIKQFRTPSSS